MENVSNVGENGVVVVNENVLTASELADAGGDATARDTIKGAKALRRSPSKDNSHSIALRKALTKDRHQSRCGRGRGAPKKGMDHYRKPIFAVYYYQYIFYILVIFIIEFASFCIPSLIYLDYVIVKVVLVERGLGENSVLSWVWTQLRLISTIQTTIQMAR